MNIIAPPLGYLMHGVMGRIENCSDIRIVDLGSRQRLFHEEGLTF
jgi:hypothetical protein